MVDNTQASKIVACCIKFQPFLEEGRAGIERGREGLERRVVGESMLLFVLEQYLVLMHS